MQKLDKRKAKAHTASSGPESAKGGRYIAELPAYQQIQRAIQSQIRQKRLKPGDTLPSERELARAHGVSLMTARHALVGLERQGVVDRRRSSGTFVAVPKIHYNKLLSTTELMAARGLAPRSRVLSSGILEDQPEIAARLGIHGSGSLVKVERLRSIGREPLAIETSYLPAERFGDIIRKPLKGGSLFTTLEDVYGLDIAYSDEEVDAAAADKRTAAWLQIPEGTPVLRIRQLIHSANGVPFLYALGHYRSDRHRLSIRRLRK